MAQESLSAQRILMTENSDNGKRGMDMAAT